MMTEKKTGQGSRTGCVHIYCGDGKGKTTASIGLAVRAAGCGYRVLIARFLKTDNSGEVAGLSSVPGIEVVPCKRSFGFFSQMTEEQKREAAIYYSGLLENVVKRAVEEEYDMLVMDEIMAVCNYGLVEEARVRAFLQNRPAGMEVVLTGRDPSEKLVRLADYVSEIRKIKHPFDEGVTARKGIEY